MPPSIESTVGNDEVEELILSWARGFRAHELTAEDIQDRFAALDVSTMNAAEPVRRRLIEAQRELDMIRWGMCEAGQLAEIGRVFAELLPQHAKDDALRSPSGFSPAGAD